ncbi:MAG: Hsp20/alpha crystallin family protein [Gammaproteobacteria bacterium]
MRSHIYEPFSTIRRLQDEMNRAFGGNLSVPADSPAATVSHWSPAVDVHEEADRFVISADVPGVDPSAIEITMEDGVLSISGERERDDSVGDAATRRGERAFGSFYRRFSLPETADEERIEARSQNGVLEISIPKKQAVQPKKIKVVG